MIDLELAETSTALYLTPILQLIRKFKVAFYDAAYHGLAIVGSCVEACGGAIECRNRSPHGLAVTLKFPVAGRNPEPQGKPTPS